jgi:hypothetical protein
LYSIGDCLDIASGYSLDKISEIPSVCRTYYGVKKPDMPVENYYCDDGSYTVFPGYYESDKSLKKRFMENKKEKNES